MAVVSRSGTRAGWKSLRTTSMAVGASRATSWPGMFRPRFTSPAGHGDRGQESESATIGLVLVEVQQLHAAVVQEALDVIGLEGGDEERGIQLALLQGRGRGSDVFLDQHGPRTSLGADLVDSIRPLAASNRMAMAWVPLPGGPTPMRLPAS